MLKTNFGKKILNKSFEKKKFEKKMLKTNFGKKILEKSFDKKKFWKNKLRKKNIHNQNL